MKAGNYYIISNNLITVRITLRHWLAMRRIRKAGQERSALIAHLHTHPDHKHNYRAGHDFVLVGTQDIRRQHEHQHRKKP